MMRKKARKLQLPRARHLRDMAGIPDDDSLRCSLFMGLNGSEEELTYQEVQSKADELFAVKNGEGKVDRDFDQLNRLVQMYSKSLNFAVTVLAITGPGFTVRPFITSYQVDESFIAKNIIPLLRFEHDDGVRYVLVHDLDRFLAPYGGAGTKKDSRYNKRRYCRRCLDPFRGELVRDSHQQGCKILSTSYTPKPPDFKPQEILPTLNKDGTPPVKKFTQIEKKLPAPLTVVVDFESSLNQLYNGCTTCAQEKSLRSSRCRCEKDSNQSFTKTTESHNAIAFFYIVVDQNGKVLLEREGVSENGEAGSLFLHDLLSHEDILLQWAQPKKPMDVKYEDYVNYFNNDYCCICKEKYTHYDKYYGTTATLPTGYSRIVAHHCHYTGKFIGIQ